MSTERILQVWFGILGIVAGVAIVFSGVLTADNTEAASDGIKITIVRSAAGVK
jgi:hypothetical protein